MKAYVRKVNRGPLHVWWWFFTQPLVFSVYYKPKDEDRTPKNMTKFLDEQVASVRSYLAANPGPFRDTL